MRINRFLESLYTRVASCCREGRSVGERDPEPPTRAVLTGVPSIMVAGNRLIPAPLMLLPAPCPAGTAAREPVRLTGSARHR